jgi:hypothetical protein
MPHSNNCNMLGKVPRIMGQNKTLQNGKKLAEYNIVDGTVLTAIISFRNIPFLELFVLFVFCFLIF